MTPQLADKLRAMARAAESPHEAAIATAKLAEAGVPIDPPRPPAPPSAAAPGPGEWSNWSWSVTGTTSTNAVGVMWFRVTSS